MNLFPCEVENGNNGCRLRASPELAFDLAMNRERLPLERYLLGIRPHHLFLADPDNRMTLFQATVELAEVVGSNTELHFTHNGMRLTLLMQQVEQFPVGKEVTSYIDPNHLYIFDSLQSYYFLGAGG